MTKVLVLYYSAYGHIETMANAVAEGAREAARPSTSGGCRSWCPKPSRRRELQADRAAPVAKIEELTNYDAIIVGTGARFGRMASQMANFLDQAGGLWLKGACTARSAAPSHRARPSTAARKPRCSP